MVFKSYYLFEGIIEGYVVLREHREIISSDEITDENAHEERFNLSNTALICLNNRTIAYKEEYMMFLELFIHGSNDVAWNDKLGDKYCSIRKHYVLLEIDEKDIRHMLCDYYQYEVYTQADGQSYLALTGKVQDRVPCNIIADFSYTPGIDYLYADKLLFKENRKTDYTLDFDYLYMYGFLCENNCQNELYMKILSLLCNINYYMYNSYILWGVSPETMEFARKIIINDDLLKLISKGNRRYNKAVKKYMVNNKKREENLNRRYNKKLFNAWNKYKETFRCKRLLTELFEWFNIEYAEPNIEFYIRPCDSDVMKIIENIITHRHDKAVQRIDENIREKGFVGNYPIYYRRSENYTEYAAFSASNVDENMTYIKDYSDIVIDKKSYQYKISAILGIHSNLIQPGMYQCVLDGKAFNAGYISVKRTKRARNGFKKFIYTLFKKEQALEKLKNEENELELINQKNLVDLCSSILDNGSIGDVIDKRLRPKIGFRKKIVKWSCMKAFMTTINFLYVFFAMNILVALIYGMVKVFDIQNKKFLYYFDKVIEALRFLMNPFILIGLIIILILGYMFKYNKFQKKEIRQICDYRKRAVNY